jgi:predicted enzyme related to lactoylglutathione lyase
MQFITNIDVDDLKAAIAFYEAAFGLKVGRRFGKNGVEMLGGPTAIYLLVKPAGSPAWRRSRQVRSYDRHWTPVHLDFIVEDLDAAVQRAQSAGALLESPVSSANWGKLALMSDPFGHGFCFIEFLGRGYDEIAE